MTVDGPPSGVGYLERRVAEVLVDGLLELPLPDPPQTGEGVARLHEFPFLADERQGKCIIRRKRSPIPDDAG